MTTPDGIAVAARPKSIPPFEGLRGLAAVWIALFHLWPQLSVLLPESRLKQATESVVRSGYLGIDFFFILSGFVLCHAYADRLTPLSGAVYRRFLWNRFSRIYPLYFVCVAALVAGTAFIAEPGGPMQGYNLRPLVIAANFLLVEAWIGIGAIDYPTWAISALCGMYVVFPLLERGVGRVRRPEPALALACLAVIALWVGTTVATRDARLVRVVCDFTVGCLLHRFFVAIPDWRWATRVAWSSALLILAGLGLQAAGWFPSGLPIGVEVLWAAPLFAGLTLGVAYDRGRLCRALSTKPLLAAGTLSYSLFVTHGVVIVVMFRLLGPAEFASSGTVTKLGVALAWLAAVVAAAVLGHRLVEAPARRVLRGRSGTLTGDRPSR